VRFKDHWGTTRSTLTYFRRPQATRRFPCQQSAARLARVLFAHAPASLLQFAGRFLYRHVG
jgi:hypothetical protein